MASREGLGGYLADRDWMARVLDETHARMDELARPSTLVRRCGLAAAQLACESDVLARGQPWEQGVPLERQGGSGRLP
ncbi:hypothetical protein M2156_008963 [Streptomyces sp. SAI-149]|jgi:hypothetical protein|nr:hypothetical protein [Streptomyces sp. SAI-149]